MVERRGVAQGPLEGLHREGDSGVAEHLVGEPGGQRRVAPQLRDHHALGGEQRVEVLGAEAVPGGGVLLAAARAGEEQFLAGHVGDVYGGEAVGLEELLDEGVLDPQQHAAARPQHPPDLGEHGGPVLERYVHQREHAGDDVEGLVREGQRGHVALAQVGLQSLGGEFVPRHVEHGAGQVQARHVSSQFGHGDGEPAGPAAHVEHPLSGADLVQQEVPLRRGEHVVGGARAGDALVVLLRDALIDGSDRVLDLRRLTGRRAGSGGGQVLFIGGHADSPGGCGPGRGRAGPALDDGSRCRRGAG